MGQQLFISIGVIWIFLPEIVSLAINHACSNLAACQLWVFYFVQQDRFQKPVAAALRSRSDFATEFRSWSMKATDPRNQCAILICGSYRRVGRVGVSCWSSWKMTTHAEIWRSLCKGLMSCVLIRWPSAWRIFPLGTHRGSVGRQFLENEVELTRCKEHCLAMCSESKLLFCQPHSHLMMNQFTDSFALSNWECFRLPSVCLARMSSAFLHYHWKWTEFGTCWWLVILRCCHKFFSGLKICLSSLKRDSENSGDDPKSLWKTFRFYCHIGSCGYLVLSMILVWTVRKWQGWKKPKF